MPQSEFAQPDPVRPAFLDWRTTDLPTDCPPTMYKVALWHADECAICGSVGRMVIDHDHTSHLSRGMLCRSCNDREGKGASGVFASWREGCNPGHMYGLAEEYWSPVTWQEHLPPASGDTMRRGAEAAGRIG